jgi:hypothetical protein
MSEKHMKSTKCQLEPYRDQCGVCGGVCVSVCLPTRGILC